MDKDKAAALAESIDWAKGDGLVPAVVQDAGNGRVLMLAYMDREALAATLSGGRVSFHSRSRGRLWTKGETSGHWLDLVDIVADCDADTLLVQAIPRGPTCHLGRASCFPDAPGDFIAELDALVADRARERPPGSYTTMLLDAGPKRIAQKVGEEGVETALAAVVEDDAALLGESADLVFHLLVLLRSRGLGLRELAATLRKRHR